MFSGFTLVLTAAAAVLAGPPAATISDRAVQAPTAATPHTASAPTQTASPPASQAPTPAQGGAPAAAQGRPRLGGLWKLNQAQSEAPRSAPDGTKTRVGGGRPTGGGFGGRIVGRGGGGAGEEGGAPPAPGRAKEIQAIVRELMDTPATLTVSEGEGTATFTYPDGRSITYKTDGRQEKHQLASATVQTRTQWEDAGLVVETDLVEGFKARQVYTVTSDPRQLVVLISFTGGRSFGNASQVRRVVYDDATAGSQP